MRRLILGLLLLGVTDARAERVRVERGETLEHVAKVHGCSTEAVLRANHVDTTLLPPGTWVTIPRCTRSPKAISSAQPTAPTTDDDRARAALAVIDGATLVKSRPQSDAEPEPEPGSGAGPLRDAEQLTLGEGYEIRRPTRAFGEPHVIDHLRGAIAAVRALYPGVHTLAIGDLSSEHGGRLAHHLSHQTGLDVDVGFYFHTMPAGYPDQFVTANADLDLEATWALLTAFARTTDLPTGVDVIFLDRGVQKQLYTWAKARGTPEDQLAALLQYPRPSSDLSALVHHWPNHADHMHVRFKQVAGSGSGSGSGSGLDRLGATPAR